MNNLEELNRKARIERLKSKFEVAKSYGSDQLTVPMPDLDALIAQLEAAQKERDELKIKLSDAGCLLVEWKQRVEKAEKEPKETQEDSDIPALRSEAANIIGLLTAEGHQTFTLDKAADFFDDVFRELEAA